MILFEYDEEKHMQMIREEVKEESENRLGSLIALLLKDGRIEEAQAAAMDKSKRDTLYKEYNL